MIERARGHRHLGGHLGGPLGQREEGRHYGALIAGRTGT
jgi:hypothetical protein